MTSVDRLRELALVARLKAGDGNAFEEIFAEFNPRLFNFLARLCRRRDAAEDLLEETWMRVVSHAPVLKDDTTLAPWLFTIARNLFTSYCRARLIAYDAASLTCLWPAPPANPSPFEMAAAGELRRRVEVALARLPGAYREALLLIALEQFTPTEAATVCGITPEAMRQRLKRARAMLARRMEQDDPAPLPVGMEVFP
jgi:RNA polymerase sigma-70 factor (ECF subfamily)